MDRRRALSLGAALPAALAATRAAACSISMPRREDYAARLRQVGNLFEAWFARDEAGFLGVLLGPRNDNGQIPNAATLRSYIDASDDTTLKALYATLFTDLTAARRVVTLTAVGETVFAAVSEQPAGGIGPDCSGMPTLHQFLVEYRGGRPFTVRHLGETSWTGFTPVVHWTEDRFDSV